MPNWCSNYFTVTGTQSDIDRLTSLIVRENTDRDHDKGGDLYIDYNGLTPMPGEFDQLNYHALNALMVTLAKAEDSSLLSAVFQSHLTAHSLLINSFNADPILKEWDKMTVQQFLSYLGEHPEIAEHYGYDPEMFRLAHLCWHSYGHISAYEWKLAHWGVGRNAYWSMVSFATGSLTASFESDWGPPEAFYLTLVNQFPDIQLEAIYLEESNGVAGSYRYQDKLWIDEPVNDSGDNIRRFAIEVFGYEYEDDE